MHILLFIRLKYEFHFIFFILFLKNSHNHGARRFLRKKYTEIELKLCISIIMFLIIDQSFCSTKKKQLAVMNNKIKMIINLKYDE